MSYLHKQRKFGSIKKASLVKDKDLSHLVEFLGITFEVVNFKAKTVDGTIINFENLEEILAYPNFAKRKLTELELSCNNEERSVDIKFKKENNLVIPETINYYLSYNDQNWGFKFEDDLINELNDFTPWYNTLTYLEFRFAFPMLIFIATILFVGIDYFLKLFGLAGYTDIDLHNTKETSSSWIIGLLWGGILIIGGEFLNRLRGYLFPTLFIALGKQSKEFDKRKKITNIVFGVILLGILINLISEWIAK